MNRQMSLLDLSPDAATQAALLTADAVEEHIRRIAESRAAEHPWGLRLDRTEASTLVLATREIGLATVAQALLAWVQAPPKGTVTQAAIRASTAVRALEAFMKPLYRFTRNNYGRALDCTDVLAVMARAVAPLTDWPAGVLEVLFGWDGRTAQPYEVDCRAEVAEALAAGTLRPVLFEELRPGDRVVRFGDSSMFGNRVEIRILIVAGDPHGDDGQYGHLRAGQRHVLVVEPAKTAHHLGPARGITAADAAALLSVWPYRVDTLRKEEALPGQLLRLSSVEAPVVDPQAVYTAARTIMERHQGDADSAKGTLQRLVADGCATSPLAQAVSDAYWDVLMGEWRERLGGELARHEAPSAEVLEALRPVAEAVVAAKTPDAVEQALRGWVLQDPGYEREDGTVAPGSYSRFGLEGYGTNPVVYGALLHSEDADEVAQAVWVCRVAWVQEAPEGATVLGPVGEPVPYRRPRSRKARKSQAEPVPAAVSHRAQRGHGRWRSSRVLAATA